VQSSHTGEGIGRIGERLRRTRERAELSREELAVESGVSWSAIAQIESGRRRNLRPTTLSAFAEALGVTLDYLVDGRAPATTMLEHRALLYESDREFVEIVAEFAAAGVERDEPTIVATTGPRLRALRKALGALANRVEYATARELYAGPHAALQTFQKFTRGRVADGASWVRIVGEPTWAGGTPSEARRWARYESLLNLTSAGLPLTLMCPYEKASLRPADVRHVCATHPETVTGAGVEESADYVDPAEFVLGGRS
jgi:transcriptional regulator with XRE-family HTH domain